MLLKVLVPVTVYSIGTWGFQIGVDARQFLDNFGVRYLPSIALLVPVLPLRVIGDMARPVLCLIVECVVVG